jgi:hypothetical protein
MKNGSTVQLAESYIIIIMYVGHYNSHNTKTVQALIVLLHTHNERDGQMKRQTDSHHFYSPLLGQRGTISSIEGALLTFTASDATHALTMLMSGFSGFVVSGI